MRRRRLPVIALLLVFAPTLLIAGRALAASEPVLKRVLLSTGGVGYFEFEAKVSGNETLTLPLELDQVDDVLKSIVVFDDKGGTGSLSLPSQLSPASLFRELPFEPNTLSDLPSVFASLQGSDVIITARRRIQGRVAGVTGEEVARPDGTSAIQHRVALLGPRGLEIVPLEEVRTVSFRDRALQKSFDRALADLAARGKASARQLTITARGEGQRTVTLGYVVSTPLWKSAYRLVLPAANAEAGAKARLQGWAILENASGLDWRDVELTLASGNPVTFRQALYEAYYVDRPLVPVEVLGRILPQPDQGAVTEQNVATSMKMGRGQAASGEVMADGAYMSAPMAAPAPAVAPPPPPLAAAEEASSQVLFKLKDPVNVGRGQSLAVPIVDRLFTSQRVAVYQPSTSTRHPLAAARLVNDSGTGLPPGVVTLYERNATGAGHAFVGDAQLKTVPAGESRFVSYALDEKTLIDSVDRQSRLIESGKIAGGMLEATVVERQSIDYVVRAPQNEARDLVLEHPRYPGWRLVEPKGVQAEQTESAFRIPLKVEAGKEAKLTVVLEQPLYQQIALVDLTSDQIAAYLVGEELSPALHATFVELSKRRAAVDAEATVIARIDEERARINEEQERIRKNLEVVAGGSDLRLRYLGILTDQEDRLGALERERQASNERRERALASLREYVATLAL